MIFNQRSLDFIGNVDIDKLLENNPSKILNPQAIISPHAGYVFSGDVAASIFNTIDKQYDKIFILSTSHTSNYIGSALINENYITPYGEMIVDQEVIGNLTSDLFHVSPQYFKNDHTIEVVLPFIQKKVKYNSIIPIMIGDPGLDSIFRIANKLKDYLTEDNLFVISSDFSHYPSYDDAILIDSDTYTLIKYNNERLFIENVVWKNLNKANLQTRMCGWSSYLVFRHMIENMEMDIDMTRYKNSGDTPYSGKDSVVGYFGVSFCRK